VTSPENIHFNNCYLRYITSLTAKIATVLGKADDAKKYAAAADAQAGAINKAFFNASNGVYLDKIMQTWQVMPLAAGVVPSADVQSAFKNLEHSIDVLQVWCSTACGATTPYTHYRPTPSMACRTGMSTLVSPARIS
jgi:hypothetical protein